MDRIDRMLEQEEDEFYRKRAENRKENPYLDYEASNEEIEERDITMDLEKQEAFQKGKEEFLSEVIFENGRNNYFYQRFEKAAAGLNNGYWFLKERIPGKFKMLDATLVGNSHNNKVYAVRVFFKNGTSSRGLASCTCPDFQRNKKFKVPCKHIWMVLLNPTE